MYPHHVFDLEPAGTFGMYPICYWQVSGRYFQPEPAMYSRCFHWFPGPLAPSGTEETNNCSDMFTVTRKYCSNTKYLVPNTSSLVCCPLSVNEDHFEATWMLDSGVSCHFTNNLNDFVEFEENVGPE